MVRRVKVYPVTSWFARCPECRKHHHIVDHAPPFHPVAKICDGCMCGFVADLEDRVNDEKQRERVELFRRKMEELDAIDEEINRISPEKSAVDRRKKTVEALNEARKALFSGAKPGCRCEGAEFGRHTLYCEASEKIRTQEF